jgi:hypothetical protein
MRPPRHSRRRSRHSRRRSNVASTFGHEVWFSYYLTCVIAVALVVALAMPDTKRHSPLGRHE